MAAKRKSDLRYLKPEHKKFMLKNKGKISLIDSNSSPRNSLFPLMRLAMNLFQKIIAERNYILHTQKANNLSDTIVKQMINNIVVKEDNLELTIDAKGFVTAKSDTETQDFFYLPLEDKLKSFHKSLAETSKILELNNH